MKKTIKGSLFMRHFSTDSNTLFNLVDFAYLRPTQEELEKFLAKSFTFTQEKEQKEKLFAALNEEQKNLAHSYAVALQNKMDELYYLLEVNLLSLGIKMGMELKASFFDEAAE